MFKIAEIDAALGGALGLARADASAISRFPNSEPAFWRSFAAIVIVAPVNLLSTALRSGGEADAGYLFANGVTVLVQWVAFPLIMIFIARLLGLGGRYGLFIIAYNWSSVFVVAALLPSAVLSALMPDGQGAVNMVTFVSIIYVLWFTAFLTRAAFDTNWINAAGIVVVDVLISLLISGLVFSAMGLI